MRIRSYLILLAAFLWLSPWNADAYAKILTGEVKASEIKDDLLAGRGVKCVDAKIVGDLTLGNVGDSTGKTKLTGGFSASNSSIVGKWKIIGCEFGNFVALTDVNFSDSLDFRHCIFKKHLALDRCKGNSLSVTFSECEEFLGVTECEFSKRCAFGSSRYVAGVGITKCTFSGGCSFSSRIDCLGELVVLNSIFKDDIFGVSCRFNKEVRFQDCNFEKGFNLSGCDFNDQLIFYACTFRACGQN